MENTAENRGRLAQIAKASPVRVVLEDGSEITGTFEGVTPDGKVHIGGADNVDVGRVETVLMDVSSDGVE